MRRFLDVLDRGLEIVTGVMLAAMMLDVLFGVADRFIFHFGAPWPEEIGRYLLIWVALLAAAIAVKRQDHFAVLYFIETLVPPRLNRWIRLFQHLLTLTIALAFVVLGVQLVRVGALQISPGSGIPLSWVFAALPVSSLFMIYYTLRHLIDEFQEPGGRRT